MLSDEIAERLVVGVRAGRYALLLGAGFSTVASSADGRKLPTGTELVKELTTRFGMPIGHPLPRLWGALPTPDRENYLATRFKGCKVPKGSVPINKFVWRSIYTLNVDDVIEQIYELAESQQILDLVTHKSLYSTPESLANVKCVHLHGSVLSPEDGYVFSTGDYGALTARHSVWGPILADELATTPFLVAGCTLDEYDLEHHLARRGGIDASRQPMPSFFITPSPDRVLEATAARYGLLLVKATAEEFFLWLAERTGKVPSPLALITPKRADELYIESPDPREARIFHRQFLYVDELDLPEPLDVSNFLRGTEPTWHDIKLNHDVIRQDVGSIIDIFRNQLQERKIQQPIYVIESPPGCGKSTLLLRIALELSRIRIPVFFFQGGERLSPEAIVSCISKLRGVPVLIIDAFADHADQVVQLLEKLKDSEKACLILGAERENEFKRIRLSIGLLKPKRIPLMELSGSEALELVRKMRSEGLLGKHARQPDEALQAKAMGSEFVVAVCEIVGDGRRFDDLVKSQWSSIVDEPAKKLLAAVSLAHSCGYWLKFAIAQRCAMAPIGILMKEIGSGSLQGLIFREGYAGEYLITGHRVLAERLLSVAMSKEEVFENYIRVATYIAPYVSRETIKARKTEARLGGRLLDYDAYVYPRLGDKARDFYERIKPEWEWNSRYWEQRALLELHQCNYRDAITHAQHAVGVETHPLTLTTLGHVLVKSAIEAGDEREARDLFFQGIGELKNAIRQAHRLGMPHIHPHHAAITGAISFYRKWRFAVDDEISAWVSTLLDEVRERFKDAFDWESMRRQWRDLTS